MTSAFPAAGHSQQHQLFADDDEETWKLLVSSSANEDVDIPLLLIGLARRLQEDWFVGNSKMESLFGSGEQYWKDLVDSVCKETPFLYSDSSTQLINSSNDSTTNSPKHPMPAAFQTDAGKNHLVAVASLLGLSEERAVQITLGAIRSMDVTVFDNSCTGGADSDESESDFSTLIGTRDCLFKTVIYHFQQRFARLSVLTECLRLEQDPDSHNHSASVAFLDSLDETFSQHVKLNEQNYTIHRGIFKSLLITGCRPDPRPNLFAMDPCRAILQSADETFDELATTLVVQTAQQLAQERTQAIEGILTLLYGQRMQRGVLRCDYVLFLCAAFDYFQGSTMKSRTLSGDRWNHLVGLICVECTAVLNLLEIAVDGSDDAKTMFEHPLLQGLGTNIGNTELEYLIFMLARLIENVSVQSNDDESSRPESVAGLSLGILLCLASEGIASRDLILLGDKSVRNYGIDLIQLATDQGGAFDYLATIVRVLTGPILVTKPPMLKSDKLFDWQLTERDNPRLLLFEFVDESEQESASSYVSADIIIFSSVAQEVLASAIVAFPGTFLDTPSEDSFLKLAVMSMLVSMTFKNNAVLCSKFWEDYENHKNESNIESRYPFCRLLDTTSEVAFSNFDAGISQRTERDTFLDAVTPFFGLLSALCYSSATVEFSLSNKITCGLLRKSLTCCARDVLSCVGASNDELQSQIVIFQCIAKFARVGAASQECAAELREVLEGDSEMTASPYKGPSLLAKIIIHDQCDERIVSPVLQIIGYLLSSAPAEWAIQMARCMFEGDSSKLKLYLIAGDDEISNSATLVLAGLIGRVKDVCCKSSIHSRDAVLFLQKLCTYLVAALTSLATLSTGESWDTTKSNKGVPSPLLSIEQAQSVLQSCANFLKWIRPLLRWNPEVAKGAMTVRDFFIQALARTDLSTGIMYYAIAPISYRVVLKMEDELIDSNLMERVGRSNDHEKTEKYGAWASFIRSNRETAGRGNLVGTKVVEFVSNSLSSNNLDFASMYERGWFRNAGGSGDGPIRASCAAMALLSEWASHVEDIAATHVANTQYAHLPLSGTVAELVVELSPQKVLSSIAPIPIPCRSNQDLSSLWKDMKLSSFDLLLSYLHEGEKDAISDIEEMGFASSLLLNFLEACIAQLYASKPIHSFSQYPLLRIVTRSKRLISSLVLIVKRGMSLVQAMNENDLPGNQDADKIICAFSSLRILSQFASMDADAFGSFLDGSALDLFVQCVLDAENVFDHDGNEQILETSTSVLRMRFSSAALKVLSSYWKGAQSLPDSSLGSSDRNFRTKYFEDASFIVDKLVNMLAGYANLLDMNNAISENGKTALKSFCVSSLNILALHFASDVADDKQRILISDSLSRMSQPGCFFLLRTFDKSTRSIKVVGNALRAMGSDIGSLQLLDSFPAISSKMFSRDSYSDGNMFDLRLCSEWIEGLLAVEQSGDGISFYEALEDVSQSYQLLLTETALAESWADLIFFATVRKPVALSTESISFYAADALDSLRNNLQSVHGETNSRHTKEIIVRISGCLGDLLLHLLELGSFSDLSPEQIARSLKSLTETMEVVYWVLCPPSVNGSIDDAKTFCRCQFSLLASGVLLSGLLQRRQLSEESESACRETCVKLNFITCSFIRTFAGFYDMNSVNEKESAAVVSLCCTLLTQIVLTDLSKSSRKTIAAAFQEFDALKFLTQCAIALSKCSSGVQIAAIKSVFSLVESVAQTNDLELMASLPTLELSQMVVRNPLFSLRIPLWSSPDVDHTPARGYIFKGETALVTNHFAARHYGMDDPFFDIWVTAMRILAAGVRTCSMNQPIHTTAAVRRGLLAMSSEFLRLYAEPLHMCLASCGRKLTKNGLKEVTALITMLVELCCQSVQADFVNSCKDILDDCLDQTKRLISSLSTFMYAMGTSQELFFAIHEYESSELDGFVSPPTSPLKFAHSRIQSEGLSSVKHEAIKFSHYASGRSGRITKADFDASKDVPQYLKPLSLDHSNDNDLERNCRLAVTSEFSLELLRKSSVCLSRALLLIWRTHPVSFPMSVLSGVEKSAQSLKILRLVEPGALIEYVPFSNREVLRDEGSIHRFGTVVSVDAYERTCEVSVMGGEETGSPAEGRKEKIRLSQVVGVEDASARMVSSHLSSAPDVMASIDSMSNSLTTGNYIMILRWCHQHFILHQRRDPQCEAAEVKQIAEEAAILMVSDLASHDSQGAVNGMSEKERYELDFQMYELFADGEMILFGAEKEARNHFFRDGRLKDILGSAVLRSLQKEITPFVQRAWKAKLEMDRKQKELAGTRRVNRKSAYRWH